MRDISQPTTRNLADFSGRSTSNHSSNVRDVSQFATKENMNYPYTYPFYYYDCLPQARDVSDHSGNVKSVSDPTA